MVSIVFIQRMVKESLVVILQEKKERRLRQIERYKAIFGDLKVGDSVSWSINKDPDPPSTIHGVIESLNQNEETANVRVWYLRRWITRKNRSISNSRSI